MAIIPQQRLFSWKNIETKSDLDRLKMVLSSIPDERLMRKLESERGKGRDDYPIRPVWNSVLAGVVFEHKNIELLRRELRRNAPFRELCGFKPELGSEAIPPPSAYSRFLKSLFNHEALVEEIFDKLVEELGNLLPGFGSVLGIDSKAIESFGNPTKEESPDGRRDIDADWGMKTYKGVRKDGTLWEKVKKWFGYKLHLIIDTNYELPVGFKVTQASVSDNPTLLPMVEKVKERHPALIERAGELSADKGYDSEKNNRVLYDEHKIKPIIDIRDMWKEGEGIDKDNKTRSLYPEKADNIVYDYKGTVFCVCPKTNEQREMAFCGFEESRGCLKYRCPAAAYGIECKGRSECGGIKSDYGRIVRVPLEMDRRIFTPTARPSYSWKTKYNKRSAVERVNSRLDVSFGFELHTIRGMKKMKLRVGIALIVMLAMAVGSIKAGRHDRMRSLVKAA